MHLDTKILVYSNALGLVLLKMLCSEVKVPHASSNATNYTSTLKYGYQWNLCNMCITLLFATLTKNGLLQVTVCLLASFECRSII